MTVDVRPCSSEQELVRALAPISHYFGTGPEPAWATRISPSLPPERMHAAYIAGEVVGGAGAFPLTVTAPGGPVRAAGVTVVGVLPTHRRRGVLRSLMRAQIDDVHARGEPIACLWASDDRIYGRFGYGVASFTLAIDIVRDRAAFAEPVEPAGVFRLLDLDEALSAFPEVYDRVVAESPGMFARTPVWWETRALADSAERRGGGGEHVRAVYEVDGRPEAYALHRIHAAFDDGLPTGHVGVVEALGATPEATAAVWRFLLDTDWMHSVKAWLLPLDHPLLLLLAEPRRLRARVGDGLWVRLVDVGGALAARSRRDGDAVVIEVADAFCPWNEGRWYVSTDSVERTARDADLRCDVAALGSAYLGGFTFAQLARARRVEELRPGAVARADALFAVDRLPWCPEIF